MDTAAIHRDTLALLDETQKVSTPAEGRRFEQLTAEFLLALPRLRRILPDPIPRHVDVGCGGGYSLLLWSQIARESFGVDLPETIDFARAFYARLPPRWSERITLVPATAEDVALPGVFDVVTTQYVLEHVNSIPKTLENIRRHVRPDGFVIHTLDSAISRATWFMQYREQYSPLYRMAHSLRRSGVGRTLRNPFAFTPPHEPRFGNFPHELDEYRVDRWAMRIFRAGFEVVDYFQTEDTNWMLVTRPLP